MINAVSRPVHSAPAASRRGAPTLPMSPRFGKTAPRPPYRSPPLKDTAKSTAPRNEDKRIVEVMKRLCVTLKKALMPAINGNMRQREKDIANALDRIRLHNLATDRTKTYATTPYKPFRARA